MVVFFKLNSILIVSSVMLNLLKASMSSKKMVKAYFVRWMFRYSNNMSSYAKRFLSVSKFPNIIDKIFFQGRFQIIYQAAGNFEKVIKYLSTFYIVSNERYLINEVCIEGFSQRLESRKDQFCQRTYNKIAKNYDIHSLSERLINDCTNENASAWLVVSCQRWCSAFNTFESI